MSLPLPLPFWRDYLFPRGSDSAGHSHELPAGETKLEADSMITFHPRPGLRILVTEGSLWVTQAGDSRDFEVKRGDWFIPASFGKVVAQAVTDVALRAVHLDGDRARVCSGV